jgi:hypothetical protein
VQLDLPNVTRLHVINGWVKDRAAYVPTSDNVGPIASNG